MLMDDELYSRIKRLAAERKTTFRCVAETALREYVAEAEDEDTRTVEERFPFIGIGAEYAHTVPQDDDAFNEWINAAKREWAEELNRDYERQSADFMDRIKRRDLPGLAKILQEEEGVDLDSWLKREGL